VEDGVGEQAKVLRFYGGDYAADVITETRAGRSSMETYLAAEDQASDCLEPRRNAR
jgi:hypothetical protein